MPYIEPAARERAETNPTNAGELNYAITELLIGYLAFKNTNYQAINDCMGALEGAKLEMYRRLAVPYEDKKIAMNGDVYL